MIDRSGRPAHRGHAQLALCLLACLSLLLLRAPTVCAQAPQQTALARSLFEQGVTAADAGLWADAADKFGRAYELKPTPGIAFNWASALIELGHLVEAGERLRGILRDPSTTPQLASEAQAKLDLITPRIAALVVRVSGPIEGVSVAVDGQPLPQVAWGAGSPTDPGEHTVTLDRAGETLSSETVALADGERRELDLSVPVAEPIKPEPPVTVVATPVKEDTRPSEVKRPLYKSWLLWTAVGVVVAGGAVATVLLLPKDDAGTEKPVRGDTNPAVLRW